MSASEISRPLVGILWFGAVVLLGSVLVLGKDVLVPLAIAVIIWYLINALAEGVGRLPTLGPRLPGWPRMTVALGVISLLLMLFGRMASQNIAEVSQAAPGYEANLRALLNDLGTMLGLSGPLSLEDLVEGIRIRDVVPEVASALSSMIGQAGLIVVYVLFLLIEQRRFSATSCMRWSPTKTRNTGSATSWAASRLT